MIRAGRAAVISPKRALTWSPVAGSKRAVVSTPAELRVVERVVGLAAELEPACAHGRGTLEQRAMSKLLIPGRANDVPRRVADGSLRRHLEDARCRSNGSKVRSPLGSTGLPVTSTRAPWVGVPVVSTAVVVP